MKRIWLITCFCVCCFYSHAQQGSLKGNINTKDFPEVSFIWNEYNPEVLNPAQFGVRENGTDVAVNVEILPVDTIPYKPKSILFLWENQPFHNQLFFTQQVLRSFVEDILNKNTNDKIIGFNIATFNNKQQGHDAILKIALPNFTNSWDMINSEFFKKWEYSTPNTEYYIKDNEKPVETDLFSALKEGFKLFENEPKNNTRAIVVITAGLFIPGIEISPIINQSLQNKIPIYIVHYSDSVYKKGNKSVIQRLSEETYGQLILSDGNHESTRVELLNCFNELNRRHYGRDYKITFTSLLKRDGNSYPLDFNSSGTVYSLKDYYQTPNFSLVIWAKQHWILSIILLTVTAAIITLGLIFGIKFFRKRKKRIKAQKQEEERQKSRQLAEQENLKRNLNATREELQRQQRKAEQEKKQAQEQEEEERIAKLMHTKNLHPRLIAVNEGTIFNVADATTTIGREDDNDIVLSDPMVSKHHAQIVFNGSGFEIYDLDSSNGVIVNGAYIESAELKSSDIIQLGEVIIKFYL